MKVNMRNGNLLIRKIQEEIKTSSGLIISTEFSEDRLLPQAEVVSSNNPEFEVGDVVYYDGRPQLFNKLEDTYIIDESTIIAVVSKD
jgi:co-chaperonin GroES (HSP10)